MHQFMTKLKIKIQTLQVPLNDVQNAGPCEVHVRNEKCTMINCLFDLDEIVDFIYNEIEKNGKFFMIKCPQCGSYLDQDGFYVDQDMEDAVNELKNKYNDIYQEVLFINTRYEVFLTLKNEWLLKDKEQNTTIVIKESDMLTEYEKNYPFSQSKQTHEFYENGWVFVNENVDVLQNNKLQSVLYLFFPSLQNNRWKEVVIYHSVKTKKQAYFQKFMSLSKMYSKQLGKHSILACGGLGFPEQVKYETRTFEVPLFSNDPDTQVLKEVDLIDCPPMLSPRVLHQLICHQGKVYALGGYKRDFQKNIDVSLTSCERYDPITQKWEQIQDLDHPRQLFTVVSYQQQLFVVGGKVQNKNNNQDEEEDLTVEFYNTKTESWTIIPLFQNQFAQKYFTERAYSFVKSNYTLVIFGGRKEKTFQGQKACNRSRQAAELNLDNGEHKLTNDYLPEQGITFDGVTDFQGIEYNNRVIFGFKRLDKKDGQDYIIPQLCKYYEQSQGDKFSFESYKAIKF